MTQYPEKIDIFKLVMDAVCSAHAKERLYSLRGQFAEDALCLIQQVCLQSDRLHAIASDIVRLHP